MQDDARDIARQQAEAPRARTPLAWLGSLGDQLRHYMHGEMTPMPLKILLALLHLQRAESEPVKDDGQQPRPPSA